MYSYFHWCFIVSCVHRRYINVPNAQFNVHKVSTLDSQSICPSRCLSRYIQRYPSRFIAKRLSRYIFRVALFSPGQPAAGFCEFL